MRTNSRESYRHRPGKILVMTAIMLPLLVMPLLAVTADLAVFTSARSQLMTVADAAALAGAQRLPSDNRLNASYTPTTEINSARAQSKAFAQYNYVLNDTPVVIDNPSNAMSGDTVVGFKDMTTAANPSVPIDNSPANILKFNSVQFTARRSADHGGLISGFFSSAFGDQGSAIHVQSTATAQNYRISGFKGSSTLRSEILPIAMAQANYNAMNSGTTSDQYSYNPATNTVTSGSDGLKESVIFPINTQNAGNWGTLNIGVNSNSTSTLGDQIRNGISPSQMATFPNSTISVGSATNPQPITFSGNPGISAGIKDDLTAIIGRPSAVPLYDQSSGNGNNTSYRVVGFAAARIVAVNFQGNPKYVIVQPALLKDPTAIAGDAQSSWTKGGVVRLLLSR